MPSATNTRHKWLRRAGWLVLIWTASVAALAAVAVLFRTLMNFVGLTV
jgi:hypothetical protein